MAEPVVNTPRSLDRRNSEGAIETIRSINVGEVERYFSLLGGGMLALYALRRSLGDVVLLFAAGALLSRGVTGHCPLYETMGMSTTSHETSMNGRHNTAGE